MSDPSVLSAPTIPALLKEMNLDLNGLIAVVRYADAERALTSAHDTPGLDQAIVYHKAGRGLRDRFCGKHWEVDNDDNHTAIKHRTKPFRVLPCNFDEYAGDLLIQPRNRTNKGAIMERRTMCNATGSLFEPAALPVMRREGRVTWLLGIHSFEGKPLRAELCLPVAFNEKYITNLAQRIILLDGDQDEGSRTGVEPVEVVDIQIEPRG